MKSIFRFLGSLRVGVVLLAALFLLVLWGTLFGARVGVEQGASRFFDSWYFFAAGIVPLPALKTVASLLFVNVFFTCLVRISHTKKNLGLLLLHISLLVLIAGGFAGNTTRESWGAFGVTQHDVILDSADVETHFKILEADSAQVLVLPKETLDTLRIAPNEPQNVGHYTVYYGAVQRMSSDKAFVMLNVKKDPFSFIPYLFTVLLLAGVLLHIALKHGGKK